MGNRHHMTPEQILNMANEKGIILNVQGNQLVYKAPPGTMTPDLIQLMKKNKKSILYLLNSNRISPHVKCLGVECEKVRYEDIEESHCLWCGHLEKGVIYLMECPKGHWQKDAKGFPLPNNNFSSHGKDNEYHDSRH